MSERWLVLYSVAVVSIALSTTARAQVPDPVLIGERQIGAALALPYLTSPNGVRVTVATVTNLSQELPINLHFTWISQGEWKEIDSDCPLTPKETTYLVFESLGGLEGSIVSFECSDPGIVFGSPSQTNNDVFRHTIGREGILFVAAECVLGFDLGDNHPACPAANDPVKRTMPYNILRGNSTVIDFGAGAAFSVDAIAMEGIEGEEFGDRIYQFDGSPGEYAPFRSSLFSNYVALDDDTTGELMLFTLDGKTGGREPVSAHVQALVYDDDGNATAHLRTFDCFDIVALDDPGLFGTAVRGDLEGHRVGHFELSSGLVAREDVHERAAPLGDGDGQRNAPVLGWLVQSDTASGTWARRLIPGPNAAPVTGMDIPALHAGVDRCFGANSCPGTAVDVPLTMGTVRVGAALTLPYLTSEVSDGGQRITVLTVTNDSPEEAISLYATYIGAEGWNSTDRSCTLTPKETTYIVIETVGGVTQAHYECTDLGNGDEIANMANLSSADGIVFLTPECVLGDDCPNGSPRTLHDNILKGSFAVVDFGSGMAFSGQAFTHRGLPSDALGDRSYQFDGSAGEYERLPAALTSTFIAPDDSVTAEVLLATLDGRVGNGPGINARVTGFAWDDDANPTSGSIGFDCFTVTPLGASPAAFGLNVTREFGDHRAGRVDLVSDVVVRNDVHDFLAGDGDRARRAPVIGWLIQTMRAGGLYDGGEFGAAMAANGAWARQLIASGEPLAPLASDIPSLQGNPAGLSSASLGETSSSEALPRWGCGLGFELSFVLPLIFALRGRRRSRARKLAGLAVLATVAALAPAPPVAAQVQPAAAVAAPYLTAANGARATVVSVTNLSDEQAIALHAIWIDGVSWREWNDDCPMIPRETTYFIFEYNQSTGGATVTYECSEPGIVFPGNPDDVNEIRVKDLPGPNGILFLAPECQAGFDGCPVGFPANRTLHENMLLADFVVVDFEQGAGFSSHALHIPGIPDDALGDRWYRFDETAGEYGQFPSLFGAEYLAPDVSINAEVILMTLDGTTSAGGGVAASLSGFAYDDDEIHTAGLFRFDCLAVLPIDGGGCIGPDPGPVCGGWGTNVRRDEEGHLVGHFELLPEPRVRLDAHENPPTGNSDGIRNAPVAGWIVQSMRPGGHLGGGEYGGTMAAAGSWARQLQRGSNTLIPTEGDIPSLRASELPENQPPDCTAAAANADELWPPNHKFEGIAIEGVTDPDDDPFTIVVTAIRQDEPTNAEGDGNTCPDASGVGTDAPQVRRERQGPGDGRVYHIEFEATDDSGASCTGVVTTCVPHDQSGDTCVDQGPLFDSLECTDSASTGSPVPGDPGAESLADQPPAGEWGSSRLAGMGLFALLLPGMLALRRGRVRRSLGLLGLAVAICVGGYGAEASAQVRPGAAIAMPYLTSPSSSRITVASITNLSPERPVTLHLVALAAEGGWNSIDFDCPLIPNETTYLVVHQDADGQTSASYECSEKGVFAPTPSKTNISKLKSLGSPNGTFFVSIECQAGVDVGCDDPEQQTLHDNVLLAAFTVIDFAAGWAFSSDAVHIQGVPDPFGGYGDRRYQFSGVAGEYNQFPSLLEADYIAPDDDVTGELILITLDGTPSWPVAASMAVRVYDDDENATSSFSDFDCFSITDLSTFPGISGGHLVGHLELLPLTILRPGDVHDDKDGIGNGDGFRRTPVMGWIVQTIVAGGEFDGGNFGGVMAAPGAWARQLTTGTNTLPPESGDVPSLDMNFNN